MKKLALTAIAAMAAMLVYCQDGDGQGGNEQHFKYEDYLPEDYAPTDGMGEIIDPATGTKYTVTIDPANGKHTVTPEPTKRDILVAVQAMAIALTANARLEDLTEQYQFAIEQLEKVTEDLWKHVKTPVEIIPPGSGSGSGSGGAQENEHTIGVDTEAGGLVLGGVWPGSYEITMDGEGVVTFALAKVHLDMNDNDSSLYLTSDAKKSATLKLKKICASGKLVDGEDYKGSVTDPIDAAKSALIDLINAYHPIDEGVPDEATNVLAKVAFDGDYNSLTNTPTFSFEEEEVAEGEGGEGGTKLVLVVSSGTNVASNDVGLAKVAKTGSWADIVGAPDGVVFSGGQVQMEGDALQARPIYVGIDTNGLYGATNDWQEICRITPREWFTGSADVLEDVSASGDSVTFSFCTLKLSPTNGLERVASEKQSVTITLPTNGCDCAGGSVTNVYVCECNGGEGCGCGGGGGDDEEGNCSCQIKTAQDVNDVEKDPEWSKWKSDDFDGWKADVDKDVADACAAITAICEHIGYVPSVWQSRADAGGGGQGSAEDMP